MRRVIEVARIVVVSMVAGAAGGVAGAALVLWLLRPALAQAAIQVMLATGLRG